LWEAVNIVNFPNPIFAHGDGFLWLPVFGIWIVAATVGYSLGNQRRQFIALIIAAPLTALFTYCGVLIEHPIASAVPVPLFFILGWVHRSYGVTEDDDDGV
jgi:hypothetical protein